MTIRSSRAPRAALLGAVLVALSACGSIAADAPRDASVEDFCTVAADVDRTAGAFAADLAEVGTPEGVSEQVRAGFETFVDALDDKGEESYAKARATLAVPEDDVEDGNAFISYMTETCQQYFTGLAPDGDATADR